MNKPQQNFIENTLSFIYLAPCKHMTPPGLSELNGSSQLMHIEDQGPLFTDLD